MADHIAEDPRTREVRRRLLKAGLVGAGALATGHLPWRRPEVKSFFGVRSAWAQTSSLRIQMDGQLGTLTPGTPDPASGQDQWEFEVFVSPTQLTITATPDANIDPELFLYGPGAVGPGMTNLLTGTPLAFNAAGPAAVESAVITVATTLADRGNYVIAIENGAPPGTEVAGLYTIVIDADRPIGPPALLVDEGTESDRP